MCPGILFDSTSIIQPEPKVTKPADSFSQVLMNSWHSWISKLVHRPVYRTISLTGGSAARCRTACQITERLKTFWFKFAALKIRWLDFYCFANRWPDLQAESGIYIADWYHASLLLFRLTKTENAWYTLACFSKSLHFENAIHIKIMERLTRCLVILKLSANTLFPVQHKTSHKPLSVSRMTHKVSRWL